jgi:putative transposase
MTETTTTNKRRYSRRRNGEQVVKLLREADVMLAAGKSIGHVLQHFAISSATFYRWRKEFAGMEPGHAKQLKELERENARLKRLVADAELDKQMMRDVLKQVESGNL